MEFRSLKYVAEACRAELLNGSPETLVSRVCTDSRQARSGDLFFALKGERFDGHDYLVEVAGKGVAAVMVEQNHAPAGLSCAVLTMDNPRVALGRLAARYREDFSLPVVAIAGSNGKTSTKELVAAVLRKKFKTVWSEASFNNDIGVPVTLLNIGKTDGAAVLEVGTNHPGELAPLVKMIRPRFGIITSIGREHLEFFGDVAGVAIEEGALAELLPNDGKLFINGDNEWADSIAHRTQAKVERVGLNEGNPWRIISLQMDERGTRFQLSAPRADLSGEYAIQLLGRHQALNATLAIAVGAELGLTRSEISAGLAECKPAKMRLELSIWNGVCVLDDAYNANADSMLAALQVLQALPCSGRRIAVLGDMGELGESSRSAHEEVGRQTAEIGVTKLFAIGQMAGVMAGAARTAGLRDVDEFVEPIGAKQSVKNFLRPGDVVLLKASRAVRMERLTEALKSTYVKKI